MNKFSRDYAVRRGYILLETPEAVLKELNDIAARYGEVEQKVAELHPPSLHRYEMLCDLFLKMQREWFSLSILGFYLTARFVKNDLCKAFASENFCKLSSCERLTCLAFGLLLHIEFNIDVHEILGGESFVKDQKSRLLLLLNTLVAKQQIDERLFGPIRIEGAE